MGSMSVSSCRCCMFVSCVHPVAVLNAAFCMTCSLLMLVEAARGDHIEETAHSRTTKQQTQTYNTAYNTSQTYHTQSSPEM